MESDVISFGLANVRAQAEDHPNVPSGDVFPLLDAIDAALKLHQPHMVDGRNADGDEFGSYQCVECDTGGVRDNWPCATYRAIAASLLAAKEGDRQ